jgi:hypothetical protein
MISSMVAAPWLAQLLYATQGSDVVEMVNSSCEFSGGGERTDAHYTVFWD